MFKQRFLIIVSLISFFQIGNCSSEITDPSVNVKELKKAWDNMELITRDTKYIYCSFTVNGVSFPGNRNYSVRWERIKNALNWEGKNVLDLGCNIGLYLTLLKKYCDTNLTVGLDAPPKTSQIFGTGNLKFVSKHLQNAFGLSFPIYQYNLDTDNYEDILGYDFDVVMLLSTYRWLKSPQKVMKYISNFPVVIYEGHVENFDIQGHIDLFASYGYENHILLNKTPNHSYHKSDNRPFFVFYKNGHEDFINQKLLSQ